MTRKQRKIKICPSCRKPSIEFFIGMETGNYSCKCGYLGPIIIEIEKIEKKKSRRKKKK